MRKHDAYLVVAHLLPRDIPFEQRVKFDDVCILSNSHRLVSLTGPSRYGDRPVHCTHSRYHQSTESTCVDVATETLIVRYDLYEADKAKDRRKTVVGEEKRRKYVMYGT